MINNKIYIQKMSKIDVGMKLINPEEGLSKLST